MLDFKKLAEVTSIEELPEGINVLVNDNGVVKQVPANKVGEMVPDILKKAAESGDGFGYTDGNELHQIDSKYIKSEELVPEEVSNAIETHGVGYTTEEPAPAINITWDGDTEGREVVDESYFKVSDTLVQHDLFDGATMVFVNNGASFEIPLGYNSQEEVNGNITRVEEGIYSFGDGEVFGYVIENDTEGITKGLYLLADTDEEQPTVYISSITKPVSTQEVVHQIDKIYMPDSVIQVKEDEDGNQYTDLRYGNKSTYICPDLIQLERGEHQFNISTEGLHCSEGDMGDPFFNLNYFGLCCDLHAAFGPMFEIRPTSGIEYKNTWDPDTNIHYQLSWEELLDPYLTITINSSGATANKTPSQITALMQKVSVGCRIKGAKTLNLGTSVADENGNPCWVKFDKTTKEFTVLVEVVDGEWVFHLD